MKVKMKHKARNVTEIITANTVIKPDGFSKIYFRNEGSTAVTLMGNIAISVYATNPDKNDWIFVEPPNVQLNDSYDVRFASGSGSSLLVVKTYYDE